MPRPSVRWAVALVMASGCAHPSAASDSPVDAGSAPAGSASEAVASPGPQADRVKVPAGIGRSCVDICDRSRALKCSHASECMPHCMAMGSLTPCSTPIAHLFDCLVKQPEKNWECAEDGVAAIRDGFCDGEQQDAVQCMEREMGRQ